MIINGIKFLETGSPNSKVVKFLGKLKEDGYCCFYGNRNFLIKVEKALHFLFKNENEHLLQSASLFLIDSAGNQWILERVHDYQIR